MLPSILFCPSAFLHSPNAHSQTHDLKGTSSSSGVNTHLLPVFQIHLGAAPARHSWLLLSSSGCTIWFILFRSPSQQVTSPSILWSLVETSVPLMQMTEPPKLFSNFVISSLLLQLDPCHLLSRIMQSLLTGFSAFCLFPLSQLNDCHQRLFRSTNHGHGTLMTLALGNEVQPP